MAKNYKIVKKQNLLDSSVEVVGFSTSDNEKKVIEKMVRSMDDNLKDINRYYFDEKMLMHLLPNISNETINDLSRRIFHTAYAVCKRKGNQESVLYMSLFKDSALKFLLKVPAASIKLKGKTYRNPNYYVKELKLIA